MTIRKFVGRGVHGKAGEELIIKNFLVHSKEEFPVTEEEEREEGKLEDESRELKEKYQKKQKYYAYVSVGSNSHHVTIWNLLSKTKFESKIASHNHNIPCVCNPLFLFPLRLGCGRHNVIIVTMIILSKSHLCMIII